MPRTSRSGVISLAERAASVPTTATRRTAGKGAPCEHWSGCKEPWTTWTPKGGRCSSHPLTEAERRTLRRAPREPWVRSGRTSTLSRGTQPTDELHPYVHDPGSGPARACLECGKGIRARTHTGGADDEER